MLFLSPSIVYWLQTLFHWCNNNTVFIVDVSRVCANSLPQKIRQETKSKRTHTLHFWNQKRCSRYCRGAFNTWL